MTARPNPADPAGETTPASSAERARMLSERALASLANQLDAGNSAQLDAYLAAMSRFHSYSFGNIMLIVGQRPDASRVAGFHAWRSLGRTVKRGEKGILIFAPMLVRTRDADGQADEDRPRQLRFRAVHVFDIAQTEGEPLPEPLRVGGDPGLALQRLEAAVITAGITLETSDTLREVEGYSAGGRIVIRSGQPPAERFSTLVHEWAHEILHQSDREHRPPKTVRETEAEAVAFVVGHAIGLELGTASADYIRLYQGDSATLAASLDRVQRTACRIIESISDERSDRSGVSMMMAHAAARQR